MPTLPIGYNQGPNSGSELAGAGDWYDQIMSLLQQSPQGTPATPQASVLGQNGANMPSPSASNMAFNMSNPAPNPNPPGPGNVNTVGGFPIPGAQGPPGYLNSTSAVPPAAWRVPPAQEGPRVAGPRTAAAPPTAGPSLWQNIQNWANQPSPVNAGDIINPTPEANPAAAPTPGGIGSDARFAVASGQRPGGTPTSSPAATATATPIPRPGPAAVPGSPAARGPNLGYYPPNPAFSTFQYNVPGSGRGGAAPIYTARNLGGPAAAPQGNPSATPSIPGSATALAPGAASYGPNLPATPWKGPSAAQQATAYGWPFNMLGALARGPIAPGGSYSP